MTPTVGTCGKVPQKTGYSDDSFYDQFASEELSDSAKTPTRGGLDYEAFMSQFRPYASELDPAERGTSRDRVKAPPARAGGSRRRRNLPEPYSEDRSETDLYSASVGSYPREVLAIGDDGDNTAPRD